MVPLCAHDHATICLADGRSPAMGATARVVTHRAGKVVEVPVYAGADAETRLTQPITADRHGRLPGLIYKRHLGSLIIRAQYRGRVIDSEHQATIDQDAAAARAELDAAEEAHAARDARQGAARRVVLEQAAARRAADQAAAHDAARTRDLARVDAKRAEAACRAVDAAAAREASAARITARVNLKRAEAALRKAAKSDLASFPSTPVGDPLKILAGTAGHELLSIDQLSFQPSFDPKREIAVLNVAPGFTFTEDGRAYYDFAASPDDEGALLVFAQNRDLLLVRP